MAQTHADNSMIHNAKSWNQLKRLASFEQAGDLILMVRKFGQSAALTADVTADVWSYGGTRTIQTTAATLSVVSSSANDTAAGTGARYLLIDGLDSTYALQQETVILNGTTPVVSNIQAHSQTPAKTTLWFRATAAANNTLVTTSQEIILVKGDYNLRTEI